MRQTEAAVAAFRNRLQPPAPPGMLALSRLFFMPDPEPPDDFSRLPNAQSASGLSSKQRLWQQHAGRAQTRIGPKPAEEQAPAAEPSAAWQELLHEGAAAPADLPMPPPARPPRRTVIASRAGPSEALVPATDEAPPPVEM